MENFDIIIIGAGPAGTCCASLLKDKGHSCLILEKSDFPRFTIGESFLPQNMVFYKEAGLLDVFCENSYQLKNGAQFLKKNSLSDIDFSQKFTQGPATTFQVPRDDFDHKIAQKVQQKGVEIYFNTEVKKITFTSSDYPVSVSALDCEANEKSYRSKFIIDASGQAKVLPKLLEMNIEYSAQNRSSYFTHIKTRTPAKFDLNKILISVDDENEKCWFWTIPLNDNRYSLGVITDEKDGGLTPTETLYSYINRNKKLKDLIGDFDLEIEVRKIQSYTSKSETKFGEHFLLIGNSGEFLDPIFSSGVTIALKSSSLAAPLINQHLQGKFIDWQSDYLDKLNKGLESFRAFVDSWYSGELQTIILAKKVTPQIKEMIISILAGYVWDDKNPYNTKSSKRLKALAQVCE